MKKILLITGYLFFMFNFVACSEHDFSSAESGAMKSQEVAVDSDVATNNWQSDDGGNPLDFTDEEIVVEPNGIVLPKVRFIGPPCLRGSQCKVQFQLDKEYAYTFRFKWRTNDEIYLAPPVSGRPIFGEPNYHYVPTQGEAVFTPGMKTVTAYIKNINPDDVEIRIGVRMSQCVYANEVSGCSNFFN